MNEITLGSLFSGIGGFEYAASLYGIKSVWASEIEPAPMRITKKHFPEMKHLGDVMKIKGSEIEPVDIITFGSPCFPAGTMVLTKSGYVPIESIKVGDSVLTHKGRWRNVTATGSHEDETYILKGNISIETTANHPIYSADIKYKYPRLENGGRTTVKYLSNIGQWTPAFNMSHKYWATPITAENINFAVPDNSSHRYKSMPEMNCDFWYFVGRWLGDGWVRDEIRPERPNNQRFATIFLCDSKDKEQELIQTVKKISDRFSMEYCETVVKIRFNSRLLCDWLTENFGRCAINKKIPSFVYSLAQDYRESILRGILDSDGHKVKDDNYTISSISKSLILGIRLLAESLGYTTSISFCKRNSKCVIQGRTVNQHDTYSIHIIKSTTRVTGMYYETHRWYLCRSATPTGIKKTVYNLSVDEDESYIADSIVVHNCQSLSVAGKRHGISKTCCDCGYSISGDYEHDECPNCGGMLELTRSGLFMESMRIIREMREKTNERYPRIAVFENVTGALSSHDGEDFRIVLSEFCKLIHEKLPTLRPEKWENSGEILGDYGSIAWRVLDAQYWGVPQRRKRIFLIADLRGQSASEILFKPESLRRHTAQSETPWKRFTKATRESLAGSNSESTDTTAYRIGSYESNAWKSDNPNSGVYETQVVSTLDTSGGNPACNQGGVVIITDSGDISNAAGFLPESGSSARSIGYGDELSPTLRSSSTAACVYNKTIVNNHANDSRYEIPEDGVCQTLTGLMGTGGGNTPYVLEEPVIIGNGQLNQLSESPIARTLDCMHDQQILIQDVAAVDCRNVTENQSVNGTLQAKPNGGFSYNCNNVVRVQSIVRRLTPVEAERLQGFEDGWTEGESDSARYKALGNSVAIPCVAYIMSGIADVLDT